MKQAYQEKQKELIVQSSNTIHNPHAMMIHFQYTPPTYYQKPKQIQETACASMITPK